MKLRVGVLRGGPSSEYEISLKTGENVLKFLPEKYAPRDIFITRDGVWHIHGVRREIHKIARDIDIAFIALHGEFGEDGKVQKILEHFKIPFTGSDSLSSALAMNKFLTKEILAKFGIKMPCSFLIKKEDDLTEAALKIFKNFSPPWVLKPVNKGSSVGVEIVHGFHDLENVLHWLFLNNDKILFEEYIKGREATCGVLQNFRGEKYYALPPIEIIPPEKNKFFDYEAKYNGETQEICPANFDASMKNEIQEIAKLAHSALGLRGYSRSDFIISPRGAYFLEINNLPGLTSESLLPKSASAVGLSFPALLEHIIKTVI